MEPLVEITPEQIRERAFDLWERHHRPEGFEAEFWLMAERELKAEREQEARRRAGADADPAESAPARTQSC